MEHPMIVQAEYSFRGYNNDELCFNKGDIITVTQHEEGGWWEGTLDNKTGWFPSNYVKEYAASLSMINTIRSLQEIQEYRSVVLKDLLESEKAHVSELQSLLENFLVPLQSSQILTANEYLQLMCNFIEIVKVHDDILLSLTNCNDRVGKLFLANAPLVKDVHQTYCAAHPRAIVILDKYKDELELFMEKQGAAIPGLLVLTTGLSKPFRRLDKYSGMLQELERYMENNHPDRGDTQRSVTVYKNIASTCLATRRQKELELQVLTGPVRGWQGQELISLGEIIHMGSVAIGADRKDRYFVLFPQTLLILSVSQRMSAFIYEGSFPLTGITVNRIEDNNDIKNAFEICGPLIEKIVAVCQGPIEANNWVELLSLANPILSTNTKRNISSCLTSSIQSPLNLPPSLDTRGYCVRFSYCAYNLKSSNYQLTLPPNNYPPTAPYASLSVHFRKLLREGKLSRHVMKALLYPEIEKNINLINIVWRRHYKTTVRMLQKKTNDENQLLRKDALKIDPLICYKFYSKKKELISNSITWTEHETFIDHNEKCANSNINITIKTDSHSQTALKNYKEKGDCTCKKEPIIKKNDILTSINCLNLNNITQKYSDRLYISNYNPRICGNYMACENLTILDEINKSKENLFPSNERHTLPTLFLGNSFNNSDLTAVYAPIWKNCSGPERKIRKNLNFSNTISQECSNFLYFPELIPVSSKIIHNVNENDIIPPPTIFACEKSDVIADKANKDNNSNPTRKCISYQYIPIGSDQNIKQMTENVNKIYKKCKCCENSQCPSPRSSDSGMVGSCSITSPDPPKLTVNYNVPTELIINASKDSDENFLCDKFSPEFSRLDICGMFRNKLLASLKNDNNKLLKTEGHRYYSHKNSIHLEFPPKFNDVNTNNLEELKSLGMFKTGLYAHWWKKEQLPNALLKEILFLSEDMEHSYPRK